MELTSEEEDIPLLVLVCLSLIDLDIWGSGTRELVPCLQGAYKEAWSCKDGKTANWILLTASGRT